MQILESTDNTHCSLCHALIQHGVATRRYTETVTLVWPPWYLSDWSIQKSFTEGFKGHSYFLLVWVFQFKLLSIFVSQLFNPLNAGWNTKDLQGCCSVPWVTTSSLLHPIVTLELYTCPDLVSFCTFLRRQCMPLSFSTLRMVFFFPITTAFCDKSGWENRIWPSCHSVSFMAKWDLEIWSPEPSSNISQCIDSDSVRVTLAETYSNSSKSNKMVADKHTILSCCPGFEIGTADVHVSCHSRWCEWEYSREWRRANASTGRENVSLRNSHDLTFRCLLHLYLLPLPNAEL